VIPLLCVGGKGFWGHLSGANLSEREHQPTIAATIRHLETHWSNGNIINDSAAAAAAAARAGAARAHNSDSEDTGSRSLDGARQYLREIGSDVLSVKGVVQGISHFQGVKIAWSEEGWCQPPHGEVCSNLERAAQRILEATVELARTVS